MAGAMILVMTLACAPQGGETPSLSIPVSTGTPFQDSGSLPAGTAPPVCGGYRIQTIGGPGDEGLLYGRPSPDGGRTLFGWYGDPLVLGAGGASEATFVPAAESAEVLAHFDVDRQFRWALSLQGGRQASIGGFSWTSTGTLWVGGSADGLTTLGGLRPLGGHGESDGFLARVDTDGELQWLETMGGPHDDTVTAVVALADGGAVVAGTLEGAWALGGVEIRATEGLRAGWLARVDDAGAVRWVRVFEGARETWVHDVAVAESTDGVWVTGRVTAGTTDLGAGQVHALEDSTTYFVARYDLEGSAEWSRAIAGHVSTPPRGAGDGLLVGGNWDAVLGVGEPDVLHITGEDEWSLGWVARFGADGAPEAVVQLEGVAIADVVPWGEDVVVAGRFASATLGHIEGEERTLQARGRSDGLVARFDTEGALRCAQPFGGTQYVVPESLNVAGDGTLELVGSFSGTVEGSDGVLAEAAGLRDWLQIEMDLEPAVASP